MSYYRSVCDKTIKARSKTKHFECLAYQEYEKHVRLNHTIQNINFFDVDKLFNDYVTNHIKKLEICLVRADFKLDFENELNAHVKT